MKKYIAGPCAIESYEQIFDLAKKVKISGATHLRGGAYKPRTSPNSFQGIGRVGLEYLTKAGHCFGIPVVSEIVDIKHLDYFSDVDIIQVGARNMQNFELLKQLGHCKKTILLKRGFGNTIAELLHSAEYISAGGNNNIILCERGIRTFENTSRFMLDIAAIAVLKKESGFSVIADPSHAAGVSWLVPYLAIAAMSAGADGVMIEVSDTPDTDRCDGKQAISSADFSDLINILKNTGSYCEYYG